MTKEKLQTKSSTQFKSKAIEPSLYKVLLLNDNVTTMEFVIKVLTTIFGKNKSDAEKITYQIHEDGQGICGIYSFEIAETKVSEVKSCAKRSKFPLHCFLEKV